MTRDVPKSSGNRKTTGDETETSRSIQFVNAYPQSLAQRIQSREIIRAHASNVHWRKKRQERLHNVGISGITGINDVVEGAQDKMLLYRRHNSQNRYGVERTSDLWASPRLADYAATAFETILQRPNRMGSGSSFDSALPVTTIRNLLAQVHHLLLQLLPPDPGQNDSFAVNCWLQQCVSHRGLLHAFLHAQKVLNRANQAPEELSEREERELIYCYSEAVREIMKNFEDHLTACDDANILAVLALASTGQIRDHTPAKYPSRGPLTAMQMLNVYGGISNFSQIHVKGLLTMVSARGGLKALRLPGLASQISYGDIIAASKELIKPALPCIPLNPDIKERLRAVFDRQHPPPHPLNTLGDGFAVLRQLLPPQEAEQLCPVLRDMGAYTIAVHDYVNCASRAFPLSVLADARNFMEHSLMSLVAPNESRQSPLYELCHLAATIYSLLVLFPVPAATAPVIRLGLSVKERLSISAGKVKWEKVITLMLWITVMGAIATIGAKERSWYVAAIDRLRYRLGVTSWLGLKGHLQEFLWFGSSNDGDGVDLWNEIVESNPVVV